MLSRVSRRLGRGGWQQAPFGVPALRVLQQHAGLAPEQRVAELFPD